MPIAIETDATARLIEGYLVEHMFETPPQADPDEPVISAYVPLRVGPFRFLCAVGAVDVAPPATPATLVIDAAELVPAAYRARLSAAAAGEATVWLDGGRVELRGCLLEPILTLGPNAIVPRDVRGEQPWIAATVREPPAFMLEPQALGAGPANH